MTGWRRLVQVDNRFAVYIRHPGEPLQDDRATFHLSYVYQPGVVFWEDREVAWQEYVAMTVDCRTGEVRAGLRRRFGPDGAMIYSDEDRAFAPINEGTAVEAAANARCNNAWPQDRADIPDGADWMGEARRLLGAAPVVTAPARAT
jgi:hypothetical protein